MTEKDIGRSGASRYPKYRRKHIAITRRGFELGKQNEKKKKSREGEIVGTKLRPARSLHFDPDDLALDVERDFCLARIGPNPASLFLPAGVKGKLRLVEGPVGSGGAEQAAQVVLA
jgi:hypothetical protein